MNKFKTILLSFLGATDVVFNIATPILISLLLTIISGIHDWKLYVVLTIGMCSSIFRAIKIGFGEFLK